MKNPIQIVSVDDEELVLEMIRKAIHSARDQFQIVASFRNVEIALKEIPQIQPDIVLMDVLFPKSSGIECVRRLAPLVPKTKIMMLTVSLESADLFDALRFGATGYLTKRDLKDGLVSALEDLLQDRSPISPSIARKIVAYFQREENPAVRNMLTQREVQVLRLVANGLLNKEIADVLGVSETTIESHLRSIYRKLQVHSRGEAIQKFQPSHF